ncbi:esterase-like activity of phytase family protein [Chitinibacteraceae bacterium HSL-7]
MRTLLMAALLSSASAYSFELEPSDLPAVAAVERYDLKVNTRIPYDGAFAAAFEGSFPLAPGSGLALKSVNKDGSISFWGLTDRGPNGDAPALHRGDGTVPGKSFPAAGFVPRLAEIRVRLAEDAQVVRTVPLQIDGVLASGLPLPKGMTGSTGEAALNDTLSSEFAPSKVGLDPEGVAVAADGSLWLVDEYGPFLMHVDPASGDVIKKLVPGAGLPDVLKHRRPNRGFEGVAVTPNGKVYAAVQSPLALSKETGKNALITRIAEYDPATGATRMLAYPLNAADYKKTGDAKIGDLVALDNTHFAIIEQGKGADKKKHNVLYVIDIEGADDLATTKLADGREVEFATELTGIRTIRKNRVLDLRDLGWEHEKVEGLALFDDGFAVINDNDFGLQAKVEGSAESDPESHRVADGVIEGTGQYRLIPNGEATDLWLVHMKQGWKAFYPEH